MDFLKLLHDLSKLIFLSCYMDFSKLIHGFLWVVMWICQSCYIDLLKLLHGFVRVVLCLSRPLSNKTKLKFDQDFKACWSFWFEIKLQLITIAATSQHPVWQSVNIGQPIQRYFYARTHSRVHQGRACFHPDRSTHPTPACPLFTAPTMCKSYHSSGSATSLSITDPLTQ